MSCLKLTLPAFALVGAVLCNPMSSFAARGVRVSLNQPEAAENAVTDSATDDDTVQVNGRGLGTTKDAALKDAFRDAIERAIGLYVDAETVAKNDVIVKDQILTHSNAYIKDYKELKSGNAASGLIEVRILATVKKRSLTTKLTDIMPTQTVKLGDGGLKSAFAKMATQEKRAGDAAALLANALKSVNPVRSLLSASIRSESQQILQEAPSRYNRNEPLPADKVALRYLFEVRLDRQKYFAEFLPNLRRVIEQISLTPPSEIRISTLSSIGRSRDYASILADYKAGKYVINRLHGINGQMSTMGGRTDYWWLLDQIHVYGASWKGEGKTWNFGPHYLTSADQQRELQIRPNDASFSGMGSSNRRPRPVEVAMITELTADAALGKASICELDASTEKVWHDWLCEVIGTDKHGWHPQGVTRYDIVLTDKGGKELASFPWEIGTANLMCIKFADVNNTMKHKGSDYSHVFITPFVGCFGESYIEWKNLIVDKSLLPKIDSIRIELAQ